MKAILYVVAILVAGGAAYFTLEHSRKFGELQEVRLKTIADNKAVSANADVKEKELKDEKGVLAAAETKREELSASISALKSKGSTLERDVAELDNDIAAQAEEFAELEKTLKEVQEILKNLGESLGEEITIATLPATIQKIEDDKKAKIASLDEKNTLIEGAEKLLAQNREESDRLTKRKVERDARIGRNSMQSVITAVNQDWGFLVIGAGSNSGFTPQTALTVERDGRFIGRVRPSSIEPTQTVAEIDFKSLATGVRLQPGDRVILSKPTSN
jgi:hypothetical protein